jgi:hypothetical protein
MQAAHPPGMRATKSSQHVGHFARTVHSAVWQLSAAGAAATAGCASFSRSRNSFGMAVGAAVVCAAASGVGASVGASVGALVVGAAAVVVVGAAVVVVGTRVGASEGGAVGVCAGASEEPCVGNGVGATAVGDVATAVTAVGQPSWSMQAAHPPGMLSTKSSQHVAQCSRTLHVAVRQS